MLILLVSVLNLLYFYISTVRSIIIVIIVTVLNYTEYGTQGWPVLNFPSFYAFKFCRVRHFAKSAGLVRFLSTTCTPVKDSV